MWPDNKRKKGQKTPLYHRPCLSQFSRKACKTPLPSAPAWCTRWWPLVPWSHGSLRPPLPSPFSEETSRSSPLPGKEIKMLTFKPEGGALSPSLPKNKIVSDLALVASFACLIKIKTIESNDLRMVLQSIYRERICVFLREWLWWRSLIGTPGDWGGLICDHMLDEQKPSMTVGGPNST